MVVTSPQVSVYVYDLSMGMARAMSMAIVGKQVDIVPHTGIVVDWGGGKQLGGGRDGARGGTYDAEKRRQAGAQGERRFQETSFSIGLKSL